MRSGQWGRLSGTEVAEFEKRFAEAHGCKHGIAVVNGTVSLRIALLAAGIAAEDEVIVPPPYVSRRPPPWSKRTRSRCLQTSISTPSTLIQRRSRLRSLRATKAIIPVHFAGQIADMDTIKAVAQKHKLIVIEDAPTLTARVMRTVLPARLATSVRFHFNRAKT